MSPECCCLKYKSTYISKCILYFLLIFSFRMFFAEVQNAGVEPSKVFTTQQ